MAEIKIIDINKTFFDKEINLKVLDCINLKVKDKEFITFFGPNGCGKTTLLNIIAGIEDPIDGSVLIGGKTPKDSKIGFVFQNYNESMLPWRTVFGNVSLPLEINYMAKESVKKVVNDLLKKVNLYSFRDTYFYKLSAGMKQLTNICRAIVNNPDILILDEPFSSLDYITTKKMEIDLLKIRKQNKKTTLFVSHDVEEAVFLADRVVVFSERPAHIKGIVKVNLKNPRIHKMIFQKKFFKLKNKVLELFENGK